MCLYILCVFIRENTFFKTFNLISDLFSIFGCVYFENYHKTSSSYIVFLIPLVNLIKMICDMAMFRLETQKLVFFSARALGLTFDLHEGGPILILKISKNHILFLTHKGTIIDLGSKGLKKKPHSAPP